MDTVNPDDLRDKVDSDLFKLHMTVKTLSQCVSNLEDYLYTDIIGTADIDVLNKHIMDISIYTVPVKATKSML